MLFFLLLFLTSSAYVINKRRPNAKHADQVPVHFYGEVEEFAWVPVWNVIPITAGSLPRFGKNCNEDDGFVTSIKKVSGEEETPTQRRGAPRVFLPPRPAASLPRPTVPLLACDPHPTGLGPPQPLGLVQRRGRPYPQKG